MKKLLVFTILMWALAAQAANWTVILAWDPNPPADEVVNYSIYEAKNGSSVFVKVADIMATDPQQYSLVVPQADLPCSFYCTASNVYAESDPSDVVGFNPVFPRKPSPLHIKSLQFAP